MNVSSHDRRVAMLLCLIGGDSLRETVRTTGAASNTVKKLRADLGADTILVAPHRGVGYAPVEPVRALAEIAITLLERNERCRRRACES